MARAILDEATHHVLPGGRGRLVQDAVEARLDHRLLREIATLGLVPGALDVVGARAQHDQAAMLRARGASRTRGQRREVRQLAQCQMDLQRRAQAAVALDRLPELRAAARVAA